MKAILFKFWDRVRSSFWFVPILMAIAAMLLAFTAITLDGEIDSEAIEDWKLIYSGGPEAASTTLGTIATSMATIAGVVFSMTLVTLTLTTSQFGSRLLRNFMRDTGNQVVLGTFVSTFLYCLLVLRSVRHSDESDFVPHFSVTLGVMLAVVSLGVFIYFIHHISLYIQADRIVMEVAKELSGGIDTLFPEHIGEDAPNANERPRGERLSDGFEDGAQPVTATDDGYLQFIDDEGIMELAIEHDLILLLERRPGHYVTTDLPLAFIGPGDRVDDSLADKVRNCFVLGSQRTAGQDVEFSVNQLVEIAVRALSPSINDPFTAVTCVDRLGSALGCVAQRNIPSPNRYDEDGHLRVVAPTITFPTLTDAAFNQIRQYGRSSAAVTIRLLEAIGLVAKFATRQEDREELRRQADMIFRGAREGLPEEEDRREVESRYQVACDLLQ